MALTGITPYVVFDQLVTLSTVPIISMINTARDYALKCGYTKMGLLGTLSTIEGTFFQTFFALQGIKVIAPNKQEKQYIGNKIETELEFGKVFPEIQENFCKIINRIIQEEKLQAVVLGCTELPLIFNGMELSVPYIDVMQIHIQTIFKRIEFARVKTRL